MKQSKAVSYTDLGLFDEMPKGASNNSSPFSRGRLRGGGVSLLTPAFDAQATKIILARAVTATMTGSLMEIARSLYRLRTQQKINKIR